MNKLRDRVVDSKELRSALWGNTKTSTGVLSQCVFVARSALGDTGKRQSYIKTFSGVGYRFVADVRVEGDVDG